MIIDVTIRQNSSHGKYKWSRYMQIHEWNIQLFRNRLNTINTMNYLKPTLWFQIQWTEEN